LTGDVYRELYRGFCTIGGGVLSPLLSNIMLDDLDKELEKRGHRFARYADDGAPRMLGEEKGGVN
jgi:retron-type reverse transcriptase